MNKRVLAYVLISLLISCDYGRISSKVRFEQASNTKIPNGFKVIKDNYDGLKDYTTTISLTLTMFLPSSMLKTLRGPVRFILHWLLCTIQFTKVHKKANGIKQRMDLYFSEIRIKHFIQSNLTQLQKGFI